jgi:small multidrug resistance pump
MMWAWTTLGLAILGEIVATIALRECDGFSKLVPSVLVILGYCVCFYCLSFVLKIFPMGLTYAIWSGVGIVLISLWGYFRLDQKLDFWAIIGIGLILAGVLIIQLLSKSMK